MFLYFDGNILRAGAGSVASVAVIMILMLKQLKKSSTV
jgi:hypothetical protein